MGRDMMNLIILFFMLPLCLNAEELVWNSASSAEISEGEFDRAMHAYVEKTYPQKVERFKEAQPTVLYAGLMWQDDAQAQELELDWNGAVEHCKGLTYAGYRDWWLPSDDGLINLRHGQCAMPTGFKSLFKCGTSGAYVYWSSTDDKRTDSNLARGVYFDSMGTFRYGKTTKLRVRCVRAGE